MRRVVMGMILTAVIAAGCGSGGSDGGQASDRAASTGAVPLRTYEWEQVLDGAAWGPRAGLRVVHDDGRLLVLGGRTPKASNIPGDSDLWGDVWASPDDGRTWRVLASTGDAFPARAYFQAVTLRGDVFVLGGQNFDFPNSTFFNDVWRSPDGRRWDQISEAAPWEGRAGLMAAALDGAIFVFGGSRNDDSAVVGPTGPAREYFNDVWRSSDGETWEQVSTSAPWEARAGGAVVVKDGSIYLLGGEQGFVCTPQPGCTPPYFNDVWKTTDGKGWTEVSARTPWSPRPGHQCEVVDDRIVCFGGFGQPDNPDDMWSSRDGKSWQKLDRTPWGASTPDAIRYDFDSTTVRRPDGTTAIVTVGGDRETFDFTDPENYRRVEDDVWWFAAP